MELKNKKQYVDEKKCIEEACFSGAWGLNSWKARQNLFFLESSVHLVYA